MNEVSNEFFCNLDFSGKRADIDSRPELKYGSVDFIVSKEYILHPLSRPSVVFAIDCSTAAQRSGAFSQCLDSIKECLNTPEFTDLYEKIGILTFDKTIQFYDLRESLNQPQVIVVSDIDDPFVPLERGFFCDIKKSRNLILALLKQLPSLYLNSAIAGSVLGSAVKVATAALVSRCTDLLERKWWRSFDFDAVCVARSWNGYSSEPRKSFVLWYRKRNRFIQFQWRFLQEHG